MVGAPCLDIDIDQDDVPSAPGDWSITLPTKMLPSSLSVVELSAAAGIAIKRTRDDGSNRLLGARPGVEFEPDRASLSRMA